MSCILFEIMMGYLLGNPRQKIRDLIICPWSTLVQGGEELYRCADSGIRTNILRFLNFGEI